PSGRDGAPQQARTRDRRRRKLTVATGRCEEVLLAALVAEAAADAAAVAAARVEITGIHEQQSPLRAQHGLCGRARGGGAAKDRLETHWVPSNTPPSSQAITARTFPGSRSPLLLGNSRAQAHRDEHDTANSDPRNAHTRARRRRTPRNARLVSGTSLSSRRGADGSRPSPPREHRAAHTNPACIKSDLLMTKVTTQRLPRASHALPPRCLSAGYHRRRPSLGAHWHPGTSVTTVFPRPPILPIPWPTCARSRPYITPFHPHPPPIASVPNCPIPAPSLPPLNPSPDDPCLAPSSCSPPSLSPSLAPPCPDGGDLDPRAATSSAAALGPTARRERRPRGRRGHASSALALHPRRASSRGGAAGVAKCPPRRAPPVPGCPRRREAGSGSGLAATLVSDTGHWTPPPPPTRFLSLIPPHSLPLFSSLPHCLFSPLPLPPLFLSSPTVSSSPSPLPLPLFLLPTVSSSPPTPLPLFLSLLNSFSLTVSLLPPPLFSSPPLPLPLFPPPHWCLPPPPTPFHSFSLPHCLFLSPPTPPSTLSPPSLSLPLPPLPFHTSLPPLPSTPTPHSPSTLSPPPRVFLPLPTPPSTLSPPPLSLPLPPLPFHSFLPPHCLFLSPHTLAVPCHLPCRGTYTPASRDDVGAAPLLSSPIPCFPSCTYPSPFPPSRLYIVLLTPTLFPLSLLSLVSPPTHTHIPLPFSSTLLTYHLSLFSSSVLFILPLLLFIPLFFFIFLCFILPSPSFPSPPPYSSISFLFPLLSPSLSSRIFPLLFSAFSSYHLSFILSSSQILSNLLPFHPPLISSFTLSSS
ncbi:hypothetical protein C7M84_019879, partial [Penaeus vannamei]